MTSQAKGINCAKHPRFTQLLTKTEENCVKPAVSHNFRQKRMIIVWKQGVSHIFRESMDTGMGRLFFGAPSLCPSFPSCFYGLFCHVYPTLAISQVIFATRDDHLLLPYPRRSPETCQESREKTWMFLWWYNLKVR